MRVIREDKCCVGWLVKFLNLNFVLCLSKNSFLYFIATYVYRVVKDVVRFFIFMQFQIKLMGNNLSSRNRH
jgi:hypothetical protein